MPRGELIRREQNGIFVVGYWLVWKVRHDPEGQVSDCYHYDWAED